MEIFKHIPNIFIVTLNLSICIIAILITWKNYGTDHDREYKKLIFIQLSFGVLSGIVCLVSKCELIIFNDYFIFHYEYFSYYDCDLIIYKILLGLYIFITGIDVSFPSAVIISRYLIVCKFVQLTLKKVVLLTFLPILISLVTFYSGYVINFKITPVNVIENLLQESPSLFINLGTTTTYFIIVKSNDSTMSEGTKRKYKEFSRIILFQGITPSILGCIPTLFYVLFFCFNYQSSKPIYGTAMLHCYSLVPFLNGFFCIFLSSKNCRTFFKFFKIIFEYFNCRINDIRNNSFWIWKFLKEKFKFNIKTTLLKTFSSSEQNNNQ
uniref:G-protein coupled receptors family 1 profile domain-containing protein n=1 Tax=Strongyloides venezuelensis TaxID=75913 RepID=A0A0K0G5S7_STRVS